MNTNIKVIAENKIVRHEYFVDETYETGIVLDGGEVKSIRAGNVNLRDGYCMIEDGTLLLKNVHIAVYDKRCAFDKKDSRCDRVLLMHKSEIKKLNSKVREKGLTLVPTRVYLKGALVKVEVGLCRGKHTFDKKQSLREKDIIMSAKREENFIRR